MANAYNTVTGLDFKSIFFANEQMRYALLLTQTDDVIGFASFKMMINPRKTCIKCYVMMITFLSRNSAI